MFKNFFKAVLGYLGLYSKKANLLFLGLDNAGKTSILKSLAKEDIKSVNPTKGFNVRIVSFENISLSIWDLGGQIAIRNVWDNYYKENEALVHYIF